MTVLAVHGLNTLATSNSYIDADTFYTLHSMGAEAIGGDGDVVIEGIGTLSFVHGVFISFTPE